MKGRLRGPLFVYSAVVVIEEHEGPLARPFVRLLGSSGDRTLRIWIEQESSIHITAVTKEGDLVELSESEALEIAEVLKNFGKRI